MNKKNTLIIGASTNVNRYSNKAIKLLIENGHSIIPLSIKEGSAHGIEFETEYKYFEDIDTVTIYISEQHQSALESYILSLEPRRVIFNPGSENILLINRLRSEGVLVENACTLVLLRTGQY